MINGDFVPSKYKVFKHLQINTFCYRISIKNLHNIDWRCVQEALPENKYSVGNTSAKLSGDASGANSY
jgi:hypothetical protein